MKSCQKNAKRELSSQIKQFWMLFLLGGAIMSQLSSAHLLCHLLLETEAPPGRLAQHSNAGFRFEPSCGTDPSGGCESNALNGNYEGHRKLERLKILIVAKLKGWNSCEKGIYYWDIIGTSMNFQKRFQSANSHQFTNIGDFCIFFLTSLSTSFLLHTCLISGRRAGSPLFCSPRKVSKRRVASTMLRPSGQAVVIVATTKQFKNR